MKPSGIVCTLLVCLWGAPLFAQEQSTKSMDIVREAAKSNKKALVALNLQLTDTEEKAFWPLYDSFQSSLDKINERLANLIVDYAKEYNARSLSHEKARELTKDYLSREEDIINLKKSYLGKFNAVLPGKKVMAYYQLENKIQAVIRFDLASQIPLAQ
jgi:hypothetical protein